MAEIDEIVLTIDGLRARLAEAAARGVASAHGSDLKALEAHTGECERIGMVHLAGRLRSMLGAIAAEDRTAPARLLSAYTSVHVFERTVSLEVAGSAWQHAIDVRRSAVEDPADDLESGGERTEEKEEPDSVAVAGPAPTTVEIPANERKALAHLLDELIRVIEELVMTGLTSATQATRDKLDASFKEASRMKLLRLGAALRYVNEEVGRFIELHEGFSPKRLVFFAHRAWLLAKGLRAASQRGDGTMTARLLGARGTEPRMVGSLEVVTLGVLKRTVQSVCTFEFRLRVVTCADETLVGRSLVLAFVFARKNADLPSEAFLHLPQPQKFNPWVLTERSTVAITQVAAALGEGGLAGRLMLGPRSTVTATKAALPSARWGTLLGWTPEGPFARVRAHRTTPLDLAVEIQEEVVLTTWGCAEAPERETPERKIFSVTTPEGLVFDAVVPAGPDGKELGEHLTAAAGTPQEKPLFGLVYYELGRLMMLPLAFVSPAEGPTLIMLSREKIALAALVGNLNLQ